ncbi:MAG TPA: hypothetical protein DCW42_06910 [Bacteroidetes bacterium]|nr:hypothetical protein [Bacteroidota bacterium]
MKSILVSVLFLFFLFFNVNASYFRSYQVEDGLAHNSVWAVMQDSRGFMWFGTNDGLNRFDGVNFKTYRKQQNDPYSLGNNFIHCLIEDSYGRFLIGTKSGLYLYNRDLENFSHIIIDKKKEISVNSIIEDPDGKIWVATNGQGFYELDSDLSVKAHYLSNNSKNGLKNNFIWSIAKDNTGTIWLGTVGGGLVSFNSKRNLFINYKDIPQIDIKDTKIFSIYCDIDNNIWIGTSTSGLCRYNPQTGKIVYYLQDNVLNIRSITEYSSDELIMGSERGLIKFNRINESFEFLNNTSSFDNLTDNSIFAVARDREGSFWIGTYFGGVNYYSPEINKFHYHYYSTKQQSRNIISGFAEDNEGKIWIGTFNDGLLLFNPKKDKFEPTKFENKYSNIQSLLFEKDKLYIGQYSKGVNILNTRTGQISPMVGNLAESNSFVNVIRKNSKGDILFNSEVGVNYYDQAKNKIETFPTLNRKEVKDIKDIKEDYNGTLWFGTHDGLYRLLSNGKWEGFTNNPNNPKSLVNDNVNCVYQDTKFRIWVGTEGGGLTLFNSRTNSFERVYDTESGFPSNMIYSILDDADGNIWVGTGGGLVRIKSDLSSFKTYGYIQDLFKIRFNLNCALRASNQVLYFGGTNGFISFNPKQITDNQKKPLIEITGFKVNNKEVTPETKSSPLKFSISNTKEITLKHNQSSFSF